VCAKRGNSVKVLDLMGCAVYNYCRDSAVNSFKPHGITFMTVCVYYFTFPRYSWGQFSGCIMTCCITFTLQQMLLTVIESRTRGM
jgi:hypothetical protein